MKISLPCVELEENGPTYLKLNIMTIFSDANCNRQTSFNAIFKHRWSFQLKHAVISAVHAAITTVFGLFR